MKSRCSNSNMWKLFLKTGKSLSFMEPWYSALAASEVKIYTELPSLWIKGDAALSRGRITLELSVMKPGWDIAWYTYPMLLSSALAFAVSWGNNGPSYAPLLGSILTAQKYQFRSTAFFLACFFRRTSRRSEKQSVFQHQVTSPGVVHLGKILIFGLTVTL